MKRSTPILMLVGILALVGFVSVTPEAVATVDPGQFEEIWLEPATHYAFKKDGNWGRAKVRKETHFVFHVPKNFDTNQQSYNKAIIVLIPPKNGTLDYKVKRTTWSLAGAPHTTNDDEMMGSPTVNAGELTEIDVSELFTDLMPSDYVTVNFVLKTLKRHHKRIKTQVVGMRFQYVSLGGAPGPQGPQGDPGPAGPAGADGTTGPQEPQGDTAALALAGKFCPPESMVVGFNETGNCVCSDGAECQGSLPPELPPLSDCPCTGRTFNGVTWDNSFATNACFTNVDPTNDRVQLSGPSFSFLEARGVDRTNPGLAFSCSIIITNVGSRDSIFNLSIQQVEACQASLRAIADNDEIQCGL